MNGGGVKKYEGGFFVVDIKTMAIIFFEIGTAILHMRQSDTLLHNNHDNKDILYMSSARA